MRVWLAPGVRLESLGDAWVAFSALSGETHQLNGEAAALIELLADGPTTDSALCAALAADTGVDPAAIHATLREQWPSLEAAGLVHTTADDN